MDAAFLAKWADRASIRTDARTMLGEILDRLLADGTPIAVDTLRDHAAVAELDARDLIYVSEGRVVLAYPWSGTPTPFVAALDDGRERFACCAIDALGLAPMLGTPVTVRARCHHCQEAFALRVEPDRPVGGDGVMAWVGDRGDLRGKACTSL
jgi:Alkylmercury lyase